MILTVDQEKMLKVKIDLLLEHALIIIQANAPYRTGELSRSFKARVVDGGIEIYTDKHYMPYTEEKWISPRWRGRQNPNENWLKETTEYVARYIALGLGGRYVSN